MTSSRRSRNALTAIGAVFVLNAVALYLFPALDHWPGLSQVQFGTWSGNAIHGLSSVVWAASACGSVALQTATAARLSRALWRMPVALVAGFILPCARTEFPPGERREITVPWFVALFLRA